MTQSLILAALAAASAPMTVKEIAAEIGKSESRTRELLKADQDKILCKKDDVGRNVFWIDKAAGATDDADLVGEPITACPFCEAAEDQTPAGPEGSFLGAARTCGNCGKTYNQFSGEEVKNMPDKKAAKRKPLNPQYKINAKVDAVAAAGGKLAFDKEGRQWVLTKRGKDPKRMTAQEFANETPETLVAAIG